MNKNVINTFVFQHKTNKKWLLLLYFFYQYYLSCCVTFRQYRSLRFSGACDLCVLWSSVTWAAWKCIHSLSASSEGAVCVCVDVRWTRLNYPLLLYSPLILIISGDLHWKAHRCRTGCSPQRLYSIIDTVLKFSQETHIFSESWCFLINYYKALSSNIWVRPKCYPVRLECSIFRKKHHLRRPNFWRIIFLMDWLGWKALYMFMSVYVH